MHISYPENTTYQDQIRMLSLALAIESIVKFEQPRSGNQFRNSASSPDFVERAKIFEQYIRGD